MKTRRAMRLFAVVAAGALVFAACSSDDDKKSDETTTTKAKTTTTTAAPAGPGCPNQKPNKGVTQTASVDPCDGLTEGQTVKVYAAGFTPGLSVGINECSTETDDTGSGCDLGNLVLMTIGEDGTASSDFTVHKGPFGKDQVVCEGETQCLISIGELAAGDVERAPDVYLTFAG